MSKNIFISYSRRDQGFVARLASDLDPQVTGVWFGQSAIQAGEKWHDEIMEGIRDCKAFILILSPDAMQSRYVREEVNKALELGKTDKSGESQGAGVRSHCRRARHDTNRWDYFKHPGSIAHHAAEFPPASANPLDGWQWS